MEFVWSDKLGPRRRQPWLLLVTPEKVHVFEGKTIPGVVAVVGTDYQKAGIWSHTTYRLEVADGVRVIAGRDGFETGRFTEGLAHVLGIGPVDRWQDLTNALGVTLSVAQEFLRSWRPKAAERLDQVEKDLDAIDAGALQLRDKAAELLAGNREPAADNRDNRLADFADDELIAELRRRGYVVSKSSI